MIQFKATRGSLWSWNLNSWERGSDWQFGLGVHSWSSHLAKSSGSCINSLVTRGQFSTRSAWAWAGTLRSICCTVSGILSKELPNETVDIFHFIFSNRSNTIVYHLRGMMTISKPFVIVKKSCQEIISKYFEVDYSRGKTEKKKKKIMIWIIYSLPCSHRSSVKLPFISEASVTYYWM